MLRHDFHFFGEYQLFNLNTLHEFTTQVFEFVYQCIVFSFKMLPKYR